jgi:hypothetical protein
MITPVQAVTLAKAIYNPGPSDFDWHGGCGFVTLGVRHLPDCDVVVPEGSITTLDWFRDALSEAGAAIPGFEALGPIPFGFALKLPEAHRDLEPLLRPGIPTVYSGHSLGAVTAILLAGMHVLAGGNLGGVFAFEPPRAGTALLTKLLAPYPLYLTINGMDPVPHLPTPPWERPREAVRLDAAPAGILAYDPIKWHAIGLVAAGVAAYEASNSAALSPPDRA